METLRRFVDGASMSGAFNIRAFWILHSLELKILISFLLLALTAFSFAPSVLIVKDINLFSDKKILTEKESDLDESEFIDMADIIAKTMSYSYNDTQLGFYLKNLTFFNDNSKFEAEKIILNSLPKRLSKKAKRYVRAVLKISEKHQVDPIWILSVMWTESHFDYTAESWAGARGLMQIMPETRQFVYQLYKNSGKKLIVEQDSFKVNDYFPYKIDKKDSKSHIKKLMNIELGVIYLKRLLNSFKNHKHATVAYNMGPGWTRFRLKKNLPVGSKNEYLDKVEKAYKQIVRKI